MNDMFDKLDEPYKAKKSSWMQTLKSIKKKETKKDPGVFARLYKNLAVKQKEASIKIKLEQSLSMAAQEYDLS